MVNQLPIDNCRPKYSSDRLEVLTKPHGFSRLVWGGSHPMRNSRERPSSMIRNPTRPANKYAILRFDRPEPAAKTTTAPRPLEQRRTSGGNANLACSNSPVQQTDLSARSLSLARAEN